MQHFNHFKTLNYFDVIVLVLVCKELAIVNLKTIKYYTYDTLHACQLLK